MREIPLTQGQVALVDDEDYDALARYKWCAIWKQHTRSFYAAHRYRCNRKTYSAYMHRMLMHPEAPLVVDHINHDTLDNRRSNLRVCTNGENMRNRKNRAGTCSQFAGIYWDRNRHMWAFQRRANGKRLIFKRFDTLVEAECAAFAYAEGGHT